MSKRMRLVLDFLLTFVIFFLLVAFVVTCCFFRFIQTMEDHLTFQLNAEHIQFAAKITFLNVLFLGLLFAVLDLVRRYYLVSREVGRILWPMCPMS